MSSVSPIAAGMPAATGRLEALARRAEPAARTGADALAEFSDKPAVPASLDIKNIRRANNYADAFGMAVDPTQDIGAEAPAAFFNRYAELAGQAIDRIVKADFKALLDMKV
jgi:hypothetical protein